MTLVLGTSWPLTAPTLRSMNYHQSFEIWICIAPLGAACGLATQMFHYPSTSSSRAIPFIVNDNCKKSNLYRGSHVRMCQCHSTVLANISHNLGCKNYAKYIQATTFVKNGITLI